MVKIKNKLTELQFAQPKPETRSSTLPGWAERSYMYSKYDYRSLIEDSSMNNSSLKCIVFTTYNLYLDRVHKKLNHHSIKRDI